LIERGIPVFELKDLYIEGELQKDFKGITRLGEKKALAVVSKDYTLVQLRDSLAKALEKLPDDVGGNVWYRKTKASMMVFPKGSNVGLWISNSVDAARAIRVDFLAKEPGGYVYIPRDVAGYRRIHRGEALLEYGDFVQTIESVRETWRSIVDRLSKERATDEDIEELKDLVGKRLAKHLDGWVEEFRKLGTMPSLWEVILESIKTVASRKFPQTGEIGRQEKLRSLSYALLGYALKE